MSNWIREMPLHRSTLRDCCQIVPACPDCRQRLLQMQLLWEAGYVHRPLTEHHPLAGLSQFLAE
jgi:hypothetical protein